MSISDSPVEKHTGTKLESVDNYEYVLSAHGTHVWEHDATGLRVEMRQIAGQTDGYGRIEHGYTALVRNSEGEFIADIIAPNEGFLPSKADAWPAVREWLQNRPEGELE